MKISKRGQSIATMEDWFQHAPPAQGARHWKDNRSAKEMARGWLAEPVRKNLRDLLFPTFGDVDLHAAEPERSVCFDDLGEPRHCDLAIQASCSRGPLMIHIEGKADEHFGQRVGPYFDTRSGALGSQLPQRIELLVRRLFDREMDEQVRALWYQLLHATAATCADASQNNCVAAIFVVQEFRSKHLSRRNIDINHRAWEDFLNMFPELLHRRDQENTLMGPVKVPFEQWSRPLYFGKMTTTLD